MKHILLGLLLPLSVLTSCKTGPDYGRALPEGAPALIPLGPDEKHPEVADEWRARAEILPALEQSIAWMKKKSSPRFFPMEGITHERAHKSLERFRVVLAESNDEVEFARRIDEEFAWFKSAGWNGEGGGVLFTGYCTPILDGRRSADATFKYPLYALPPDLVKGPDGEIQGQQTTDGLVPYPQRHVIDAAGLLEGQNLELAWLRDPIDAYIAHVNGSAFLKLENGDLYRLGYAGKNGRRYTSLGQELVKDDKLEAGEVSLRKIREWAAANPSEVERYLNRNDSYVFFTPIQDNPHGSLDVPVSANRSLATDKRLFPRGAVVYVTGKLGPTGGAALDHFMLDQDTGGAIRTAGRADVYLGIGPEAEGIAGTTRVEGQLYYLFVK